MSNKTFVPENFVIPPVLEKKHFRLRMLSVNDVEKDYEAVMETQERFHAMGYEWPREGFTIEENLADLKQHHQEFLDREAFAYTVVSPDESRVLGCLYINPTDIEGIDARVRMWVRQSEYDGAAVIIRARCWRTSSRSRYTPCEFPGGSTTS